jgi:hypothetical protein
MDPDCQVSRSPPSEQLFAGGGDRPRPRSICGTKRSIRTGFDWRQRRRDFPTTARPLFSGFGVVGFLDTGNVFAGTAISI